MLNIWENLKFKTFSDKATSIQKIFETNSGFHAN